MADGKRTIKDLQQLQAYPLSLKIKLTQQRIREWVSHYGEDGVYISFSGGKDSTVLLDIARKMYPGTKAVFFDTGLEFPEIRQFVRTFDNVDWVKPDKNFRKVIEEYGYPFISKEVSECVWGAKKYLTEIIAENEHLADRQTDRQTDNHRIAIGTTELLEQEHIRNLREGTRHKYQYETERILGTCRQEIRQQILEGGGYDNKYRKLRGIGEYFKRQNDSQKGWSEPAACDRVGDANERQKSSNKGEYP